MGDVNNYVITLTTSNAEGCITECEIDVAVIDTISPVILTEGSTENGANLGANPTEEEINNALGSVISVTDDCGSNNIVVTTQDSGISSNGDCGFFKTRSFTATDVCGNSSVVTRTITWTIDTIAPSIEYQCDNSYANNIDLGCNPSENEINSALCTTVISDNCDTDDVVITIESDTVSAPGCNYTLTRAVTATDRYGNTSTASRSVSYKIDLDAPVITATGSVENGSDLGCNPSQSEINAALGTATAQDLYDGELPVTTTDEDVVIDGCLYSQTRNFSAIDDCGNESSVSRTISWIHDVTPPLQ